MSTEEETKQQFIKQVQDLTHKAATENPNLSLLVLATTSEGNCIVTNTVHFSNSFARIQLLAEVIRLEAANVQQAMYRAVEHETVSLVQKSTEGMVKQ